MSLANEFIRIALVDDHAIVREGYRRLFERCVDFRIIGEAADAEGLMRLAQDSVFDVALIDISMPGLSGIEATRKLLNKYPNVTVLISSMHDEPIFAKRAFEAGALGYITKAADPETLINAILKVASGQKFLSHDVASQLASKEDETPHTLSPKEFEILRRIVAGDSLEMIAETMSLSPKTVANYQSSIKQKLKVETSVQLVSAATKLGLVSPTLD